MPGHKQGMSVYLLAMLVIALFCGVMAPATPSIKAAAAASPRFGVDTNDCTLKPAVAKSRGVTFVGRYISADGPYPAGTSIDPCPGPALSNGTHPAMGPTEAEAWTVAGVPMLAIWEVSRCRAFDGYAAGVTDAQQASLAMDGLGGQGEAVYFTADIGAMWGCPMDNPGQLLPYFNGIHDTLKNAKRIGAYGPSNLLTALFNHHLIGFGWQRPGPGDPEPRAQIRQYDWTPPDLMGTDQMDYDHAYTKQFGQWRSSLATTRTSMSTTPHSGNAHAYGHVVNRPTIVDGLPVTLNFSKWNGNSYELKFTVKPILNNGFYEVTEGIGCGKWKANAIFPADFPLASSASGGNYFKIAGC